MITGPFAIGQQPAAYGQKPGMRHFTDLGRNQTAMRDFTKLEMWNLGMDIADLVFDVFEKIPSSQAGFKIRDQATDAACSIPSNIAEGSSRRSEKEKFRFFEFALGSAFELQTRLLIIKRRKWTDEGTIDGLLDKIVLVQKKIGAFMGVLST